jgi:hypothetical protein
MRRSGVSLTTTWRILKYISYIPRKRENAKWYEQHT